jgi:hypothetical protein
MAVLDKNVRVIGCVIPRLTGLGSAGELTGNLPVVIWLRWIMTLSTRQH